MLTCLPVRYCFSAKCFLMLGNRNKYVGAKLREYGDQPGQSHSHAQQPLQPQPQSWWNKTPFVSFPHSRNVSSTTTFQSPELLNQCGFIWKETMQLASGKVEFNAWQVSFFVLAYELFSSPSYTVPGVRFPQYPYTSSILHPKYVYCGL